MKRTPVGAYSYAVLQALKAAPEPLSRSLLARALHDGFTPPIKPLWAVLEKLVDAGLLVRVMRHSRGNEDLYVWVWKLADGAAWKLRGYTQTTEDDLS